MMRKPLIFQSSMPCCLQSARRSRWLSHVPMILPVSRTRGSIALRIRRRIFRT